MAGNKDERPEVTESGEKRVTTTSERDMTPDFGRRSFGSLWNEMERFMEETFRAPLFSSPFRSAMLGGAAGPSLDMFEEENEIVVKADLPGMKLDDISVKVVDNNLILSGERKAEEKVEKKDFLRIERSFGSFHRSMRLPDGLDHEHASATFKDGVLEVRIPRTTGSPVHEIAIH